uniref:Major sperm protein n=1 Tax=Ascaris lumbricoides TaxID=6252 RepID=A0A0M3HKD8_ASCLU
MQQLTFNAGKTVPDSGKHYYAVYYIKGTDDAKAPRACWKDHKGDPDGTKRLKVYFKKDDEGEKKDEKKEEKEEKKEGEGKKDDGEKKDGEKKEGEEKKE